MTDAAPGDETPVGAARAFLASIAGAVGVSTDAFAGIETARPDWPPWPQPGLSSLVGPRSTTLANLDLRWLHRFEAGVGALGVLSARVGGPGGGPSGLSLLVERAAMLGHHGWGQWSAGTSCRMIRTADGWLAVNLPREDDLAAVPAWLECAPDADAWQLVTREAPTRSTSHLVERAALLGLAAGVVPGQNAPTRWNRPVRVDAVGALSSAGRPPVVVDLSSLWAGPLCGWYLARAGATVLKVESTSRPDASRRATPGFHRRLNGGKELVELDLATTAGVAELRELIDRADIVIEASRPRVVAGWGIEPATQMADGTIWCSITGYGRVGEAASRIAFGDDAAAAGGLVTYVEDEPWFIGDAAADPVAGVTAALGVLALWTRGASGMVEVSMCDAVSALTGGSPVVSQLR